MLKCVLTMAKNHVMGDGKTTPWEQPKSVASLIIELTKNAVAVFGSSTWILDKQEVDESAIKVVLSDYPDKIQDCDLIIGSSEDTRDIVKEIMNKYPNKDIVFIGGMKVFSNFISMCHDIYINVIDSEAQGSLVFSSALHHYIETTSCTVSKVTVPEIPTFPRITMYHYRRSIH